jgi:hypothetical protein
MIAESVLQAGELQLHADRRLHQQGALLQVLLAMQGRIAMMSVYPQQSLFSWCSMFVRTALAVLDHNANCSRDQKLGRDGQPSFTVKVN